MEHNIQEAKTPSRRKKKHPTVYRTESDWNRIIDIINDMQVDHTTCPEEIYINLGIPRMTFEDNLKRNDALAQAYDTLLIRIGIAINKNCSKKNLGTNSVAFQALPDFLPRWKSNVEWRSKLKDLADALDQIHKASLTVNRG